MRKLATIRRIAEVRPIEGADAIECAVVDGWTVVVRKGEFEVDELVIYCEIDSWVPTELAPFLSKDKEPRVFNGVRGERLRTVKLCGQLSQGLILDSYIAENIISPGEFYIFEEGADVTELLGIQKWEATIPACLAGIAKSNFPTSVPKTDQERVQNLKCELQDWIGRDLHWEVTEKLDGSSCTIYLPVEGGFEVCSRNLSLEKNETNSFWKIAIAQDIESRMRSAGYFGYAIQGELIGEGIQGNPYKIKGQEFHIFDIYNVVKGEYLVPQERYEVVSLLELKHVPVVAFNAQLKDFLGIIGIESILKFAERKSLLNKTTEAEGVVFKCVEDPSVSFKVISNNFLLLNRKIKNAS